MSPRSPGAQATLAVRALRVMLAAFPRAFRARYASEMVDVFAERYAAVRQGGGWVGAAALWLRTARDILISGTLVRVHTLPLPGRFRGRLLKGPPVTRSPSRRGANMANSLLMDVRYAFRSLFKRPGFTVIAVATLALGIGATTAVFSVVNGVLINPLPFSDADRLVRLWSNTETEERDYVSGATVYAWREQSELFEDFSAYWYTEVTLRGRDGDPVRVKASFPHGDYFSILGVTPLLGRALTLEDGKPGEPALTMISHGLWQRRFGGDPDIIGKTISIEGAVTEIVGVVPSGAEYPVGVEVWGNLRISSENFARFVDVVAKLRPDVSVQQARAEVQGITSRLAEEFPQWFEGRGVTVQPLREVMVGEVRPVLFILLGATVLVLLIACANVANLLLARTETRHREVALRTALGAGRVRLVRQFLTESVVLGVLGLVAGLALAVVGVRALLVLAPAALPRVEEISIDGMVLLAAATSAVVTGVLFGLAPALQLIKTDVQASLKEGGHATAGGKKLRLRNGFVVTQLALAVMLVVGSGLLIRSFGNLRRTDPGFSTSGILTFELNLPRREYRELETVADFYADLLDEARSLPGVQAAGMTSTLPLGEPLDYVLPVRVLGVEADEADELPRLYYRQISPEFFSTMGMSMYSGRPFDERDKVDAPGVVILNRAAADLLFDGEDVVGRRISAIAGNFGPLGRILNDDVEIVGVVDNVNYAGLRLDPEPSIYYPHRQAPFRRMTVALRTSGDPALLGGPVRTTVQTLDSNLPLGNLQTVQDAFGESIARDRFAMLLVGVFSFLALSLAAIGVYGVLSYTVSQRTSELGIRMALGANRGAVLGLVLRQSLGLIFVGVGGGIIGALLLTRVMSSQLFGVTPTDPLTFVAVTILLSLVGLGASYLPAARATRVSPMTALRYE